jgi:hypothetical protein
MSKSQFKQNLNFVQRETLDLLKSKDVHSLLVSLKRNKNLFKNLVFTVRYYVSAEQSRAE